MTGVVAGIGARVIGSALVGKAGSIFSAIPRQAWEALAVIGYVIALITLHQHYAHAHDAALVRTTIEKRDGQWRAQLAKAHAAALADKVKGDRQAAAIAQNERIKHDENIRLNAAAAAALRLRGPGAASAAHCGQSAYPGAAAAPDRRDQAAPAAGASSTQVLAGDSAIVPWGWLVRIVQEHDDLLADVQTVIEADKKQRANWPKEAATPR